MAFEELELHARKPARTVLGELGIGDGSWLLGTHFIEKQMNSIDLQPVLKGNTIYLRPLNLGDFEALYQVASDPKIWELHPDSERYKREIFRARFFESALASGGALAIEENDTGRIIGSSRYYEWKPDTREVSIGYTFIERQHWGIGTNRELKDLMLRHIYKWAAAVWFHVGKTTNLAKTHPTQLYC